MCDREAIKDGDVLTTKLDQKKKKLGLSMSVVFGTDKGTVVVDGCARDFKITACMCNDGERFTGDSMRWALDLVPFGRAKRIRMDENGSVKVRILTHVPPRQGRVILHPGYWEWLYVYGKLCSC